MSGTIYDASSNGNVSNINNINNINNTGNARNTGNTGLESIMKEFRIGDKKSNVVQLNINAYFPNDPVVKVASLLEQSNNLSNKTYRMYFDPIQEIVLKKMVGEDMLNKRLIIEEHDFFKGIFMLNYYCSVIAKSHDVVDSLYRFAVKLEQADRSKDPIMADVVEHILQDSFKKGVFVGDYNRNAERSTRTAYDSMKQDVALSGSRFIKVSPIYSGAAQIITDTVTSLGRNLPTIESRADLSALIFTDVLYPYIRTDPNLSLVDNLLERKDFLYASITALQIASKNYYAEHIDKKIREGQ